MVRFAFLFAISVFLIVVSHPAYAAADATVQLNDIATEGGTTNEMTGGSGPAQDKAKKESGGLPQLNVATYPSQIFWLLVTFTLLYIVFSKKTLPEAESILNARHERISGTLAAAETLRLEADTVRADYEKNLAKARADALSAIQEVESEAKARASQKNEMFRRCAEDEIATAEARVESSKVKAMNDMTALTVDIASMAAEKITGVSPDRQKAKDIVQSLSSKAEAA